MGNRLIVFLLVMLTAFQVRAQQSEYVIIITTDGFRWQELFKGMDAEIANDKRFNEDDSAAIYRRYWAANEQERRERLLPFFWNTIAKKGQLYGNRGLGNKVNNANPYRISYPGYSELLCGYVDEQINSNNHPANPNTTLLEYLNKQPAYRNKVAVFGAWNAFDRIINEERSGIPVVCAYDATGGARPTPREQLLNDILRDSYRQWGGECFDVFTHYAAMEHLKTRKPSVLYIAYGETDEWAHSGKYSSYLNAAKQVDAWINDIWNYVQSDPHYKNKTTLFITTDHGRGDQVKRHWTDHGSDIVGADETWMAVMGPGIPAKGEVKTSEQLYQQQFAQTIARILGTEYKASHPIAAPAKQIFK
jgi:hypothetical protein